MKKFSNLLFGVISLATQVQNGESFASSHTLLNRISLGHDLKTVSDPLPWKHRCDGKKFNLSKTDDFFQDQEEGTESGMDPSKMDIEFVDMESEEIPDKFLKEMQDSAPGQLQIMKEVSKSE